MTDARARVLRAIGFMCLAALVLPFLNASVKYLAASYPVPQILWARFTGHLLFVVLLFAPRHGLRLFVTRRPGVQAMRSALLLTATACYFSALPHVPLTTAAAIGFLAPLVVTVLAAPMLGEHVGPRRWAAVLAGFAGAMVIIRPGLGGTHWAAALILVTATAYALYQILTRRVAGVDRPETTITYAALLGTLAATPVLPFVWEAPASLLDALVFVALGVFAGTGHFFVVKAFERGAASLISPFGYLQLVGTTALGFVLFDDLPDVWTWVGAAMIVAGGLYVTCRESRGG